MFSDLRERVRLVPVETKKLLAEYLEAKRIEHINQLLFTNTDRETDLLNKGRIDVINDLLRALV